MGARLRSLLWRIRIAFGPIIDLSTILLMTESDKFAWTRYGGWG